ncbi:MAG: rod-binding protein [Lachnospiraceae bacterium]
MASILDTSSIYNTYYNNINSYTGSSLQNKLDNMGTTEDSDKLMEVCKDFESYFVQKIIEESKKSLQNEDEKGEYMQYFSTMLNQTYADAIVDGGGLGLAQQLYDSMTDK